jgi:ABC-type multidrug transport system fused ATPase/permease subunit
MRGVGAGARIFDLLERTPKIHPGQGQVLDAFRRGVVRFENIKFKYPSRPETQVLDGFDLELAPGTSIALV